MIFAIAEYFIVHAEALTSVYADQSIPARYRGATVLNKPKGFNEKLVALTFDDGPDKNTTPAVLEILKSNNIKATFFVLGNSVRLHPDITYRTALEGHVIGSHSWNHPAHTTKEGAKVQIWQTAKAIYNATGQWPSLYRPPYGIQKSEHNILAKSEGYASVLWNVVGADAVGKPTVASIIRDVLDNIKPGSIVLFHDSHGKKDTITALPTIISGLNKLGYKYVTVPEMLRHWDAFIVATEKAKAEKAAKAAAEKKENSAMLPQKLQTRKIN